MMGDPFSSVPVDERGVVGDRGWAVRDEVRGGIRGAKKIGGLMRLHASYVGEPRPGGRCPRLRSPHRTGRVCARTTRTCTGDSRNSSTIR